MPARVLCYGHARNVCKSITDINDVREWNWSLVFWGMPVNVFCKFLSALVDAKKKLGFTGIRYQLFRKRSNSVIIKMVLRRENIREMPPYRDTIKNFFHASGDYVVRNFCFAIALFLHIIVDAIKPCFDTRKVLDSFCQAS